ncbi:MAG: prolipoprotein diacylglyceryl transferase [Rickettsiales bacterium]|jgi:phosphatidylglycerol:prolipoprotein diacylglycerol transferase|nr:prolipoprotein diacylglyceryl transferase [Rickettsiales bacterium]
MAIVIDPISPVALSIFGFELRWYALAYVAAFIIGFFLYRYWMRKPDSYINLNKKQFDDLFTTVVLGVILGGRLGYVLFYNLSYFLQNPLKIFAVWEGGMSFHGGMLGVIIGVFIFAALLQRQKHKAHEKAGSIWDSAWHMMDLMAVVAPIGLLFGRIANFINMEVMGRVTDKPWGVVFNGYDTLPRHASPLYEAALEGLVLFIVMLCLYRYTKLRKYTGALSGAAAMFYAVFRIICEQFRAPDVQIGFLTSWGLTMGQLLSGLMFFAGAALFAVAFRKK